MRTAFFMPFPGTFLTGCRGCHRFFKLSIYRCGITLKTCSTPRVYILYKNACQPRQPVKIRLFLLPEGPFFLSFKTPLRSNQNALAFKVKRPCVSSQTHLRFRLNALAFFCLPICLKVRNGFRLDLYVWVALYVGSILNIIIFKFQFQLNRSGTDVLIHTIFFFRVGNRQA